MKKLLLLVALILSAGSLTATQDQKQAEIRERLDKILADYGLTADELAEIIAADRKPAEEATLPAKDIRKRASFGSDNCLPGFSHSCKGAAQLKPLPTRNIGSVMLPPRLEPTINAGETVTWTAGERTEELVVVAGTLLIENYVHATVRGISVLNGGSVIFCSPGAPCTDTSITMTGELDLVNDPYQWFPGIVVDGHIEFHGAETSLKPVYAVPDLEQKLATKNAQDKEAGHRRNNRTSQDPDAWVPPVITVAGDRKVAMSEVLESRGLPTRLNLTRGIRLEGGHLAIVRNGTWHIDGLELKNVGRTTIQPPDDTMILKDGTLHIGTNMRGRYALHWHHNKTDSNGVVRNVVVNGGPKWGVVIHGTDNITIEDSLTWAVAGAGFNIEGLSVDNAVFRRVIAAGATGLDDNGKRARKLEHGGQRQTRLAHGREIADGGLAGDGFWFEYGLGWSLEDSIALGNHQNGYFISSYWRKTSGEDASKERKHSFKNNVAWGNGIGLWITWDQGVFQFPYVRRTYDIYGFHNKTGIETYHTANLTFSGELHGDPIAAAKSDYRTKRTTIGLKTCNGSYENGGLIIDGMSVTGYNTGFCLPANASRGADFVGALANISLGNDVNIRGSTSIRKGGPITHTIEAKFIGGSPDNPGNPHGPTNLLLRPSSEPAKHPFQTTVILNGKTHNVAHSP